MMSSHVLQARAAGATRLVGVVAGLAVPPVLLARVIGNPLPTWPVDWTGVAEALRAGLVPSTVWVDILGVVAWLAWTVLLAMLLVEVLAVVRDRPSPSAVPVWVRRLAQVLVSAVLALAEPPLPRQWQGIGSWLPRPPRPVIRLRWSRRPSGRWTLVGW